MKRRLAWGAVLALGLGALLLQPVREHARGGLLLLGPFAELAAEVQWLRFHSASLRGEEARALELAESALALAPADTAGWQALAAHLVFDLAALEREPEPSRRRARFAAGLEVLRRGAAEAERPAELELFRALVLVEKARSDPALDDAGTPGLLRAALAAFERAAALGDARAAELVPQVRAELEAAR